MRSLLLFLAGTLVAAAQPAPQAGLIFPLQKLHAHSSSIVELKDGRLMTCWYIGSGERTADDVKVQAAFLRPGAKQWDAPFTLADTQDLPDTNPILFVDRDQRLWSIWTAILDNHWESALLKLRIANPTDISVRPRWSVSDNIILLPRDFEKKLTAALPSMYQSLPEGKDRKEAEGAVQRSGSKLQSRLGWMPRIHPLQLPSGRVLLPLYSDNYNLSLIGITDDGGLTWKASEPLISLGGVQPALVRHRDGTISAYMRDNGPPPQRILVSESKDDGITWSAVRDSDIPNPGSSVDIIALRSGAWCLILNDTEQGRHRISAWLSDDEGKTWKWRRTLENDAPKSGGHSYPSLIQTRDGAIHVTYSHTPPREPGTPELQTIKHVRFTEEWLRAAPVTTASR